MLALLWSRVEERVGAPAQTAAPAVQPSASAAAAGEASARRGDVPITAYAARQWSSVWEGGVSSDDEDDAAGAVEEPLEPREKRFKRLKKWKKKGRKATAREIARKMQDPEDEEDDGNGEPALTAEDAEAEALRSPEQLRAAVAAEDEESASEEEAEAGLLGADAPASQEADDAGR